MWRVHFSVVHWRAFCAACAGGQRGRSCGYGGDALTLWNSKWREHLNVVPWRAFCAVGAGSTQGVDDADGADGAVHAQQTVWT
eukprot:364428-Chlamydomonas_euryale.AAC.8